MDEFNIGDVVTFRAYEEKIQAKVMEVYEDGFYLLHGKDKPLISRCSGNSIIESKYYTKSKEAKYKDGDYLLNPPPVNTVCWSSRDWINYIDSTGVWL